jgi:hypothetical protein
MLAMCERKYSICSHTYVEGGNRDITTWSQKNCGGRGGEGV